MFTPHWLDCSQKANRVGRGSRIKNLPRKCSLPISLCQSGDNSSSLFAPSRNRLTTLNKALSPVSGTSAAGGILGQHENNQPAPRLPQLLTRCSRTCLLSQKGTSFLRSLISWTRKSIYLGAKEGELTQKHGDAVSNRGDCIPLPYSVGAGQWCER